MPMNEGHARKRIGGFGVVIVFSLAGLFGISALVGPVLGSEVRVLQNLMMPVRDEVRRATDIYLPQSDSTQPETFSVLSIL